MKKGKKNDAGEPCVSSASEKPELSAEAMALMAKGDRLVLLALSSISDGHAGWPVAEHHTQSRVLAALASSSDLAAETLDTDAWREKATPSYHAMRQSPRKRSHPYLRQQKNTEFSPSIRAKRAGLSDGVEALSVGLAYAAPEKPDTESGQERRAGRISAGRIPKKPFRNIKVRETRHDKRLESKAWKAFKRKRHALKKNTSDGDWNRLMMSSEQALRAFFSHVERVAPPTGGVLNEWRKKNGLQAAAGYFSSLRQRTELRAAMMSENDVAHDAEGFESAGGAKGAITKKTPRL